MNGMNGMSGGMGIWWALGILLVVFLVLAIIKMQKR